MKAFIGDAVPASYTPQRIPRFQGNPYIEALPPAVSDDQVFDTLMLSPDFDPEQRHWEPHERLQQLKSLGNFMVPFPRHLELARTVDSMLRESYVGRLPKTSEYMATLVKIYERQKAGETFSQSPHTAAQPESVALIGASGLGKSTTLRRWLAHYPQVIHHEGLGETQVTYLYVDMRSSGNSVKALVISIIQQLDRLLPAHGYARMYLKDVSRTSSDALMMDAARLMHIHRVGLLVCDEVQNLVNHAKGAQQVMTELVTMCNEMKSAILFVGTLKATKILGVDLRQARRATGGLSIWDRLPRYDAPPRNGEPAASDWAEFVSVLWRFQWVRTPLGLNDDILDLVYDCTQGILDLAIKLFAIAQARAIIDGSDRLTPELLKLVYEEHFSLLHPIIEALATNDMRALSAYEDVSPPLGHALEQLESQGRRNKARARMTKPGDPGFKDQVGLMAMAAGFPPEQAIALADEIDADGTARDTVDAMGEVHKKSKPVRRARRKPADAAAASKVVWPDFGERPEDYRRAMKAASEDGTTVLAQLQRLGMAIDPEELVPLD